MIGWIVAVGAVVVLAGIVVLVIRVIATTDDDELQDLIEDVDEEALWDESDDGDAAFVPWPVPTHQEPQQR